MPNYDLVKGFLRSGIFEAVTKGDICHIPNVDLEPVLDVDQALFFGSQILRSVPHRANFYDNRRLKLPGGNIPYPLTTPASLENIREGATMALSFLHHDHPVLETLCLCLSGILGTLVQVNAYLGSGGSTGLGRHADNHDIIVWQQQGTKLWEVDTGEKAQPERQIVMAPRDFLYIPRDRFHRAETSAEGDSLHLTFGFRCEDEGLLKQHLQEIKVPAGDRTS